jgi:SH3-like domain-containing protein
VIAIRLSAACAVVLTLCSPAAAMMLPDGYSCAQVQQTEDGFLAVRTGPSPTAALLYRLRPGAPVQVADCNNDGCRGAWRRVRYSYEDANGDTNIGYGWVNGKYLGRVECP